MMDAMRLSFGELVETGKFYDFLQRYGWRVSTQVAAQRRNVRFDLPFNLTQKASVRELAVA